MADKTRDGSICSLPNEILITIFSLFSTRSLLPLTTASHRIHDLIVRIIHHRLLCISKIDGHQIILECYLPWAKLTTPYFVCDFLGTDIVAEEDLQGAGSLRRLRRMYSHFHPAQPEGDRKVWKPVSTGGWLPTTMDEFLDEGEVHVSQDIDLESFEVFAQLQSVVSMVKKSHRQGYFLSNITISEGLTRVWRNWLLERAEYPATKNKPADEHHKKLLWSSLNEHTGLRLRVNEIHGPTAPILTLRNEAENVGYKLEYEELVVRTSQILLAMEHALEQESHYEGKAIVIIT